MALALCLVVAGCGNADDEEEPTSISKVQYVKRADEICAKTETKQQKLVEQFGKEKQNANGASQKVIEETIVFAAIPPMSQQIEELAALPAPEKEAAKAQEYIDALRKGLETVKEEPGTLLAEPGAFTKAEEIAQSFGFQTCRGA